MQRTTKLIKFTRHAKNRMRWHKISEDDVVNCLANPDFQESALKGKNHSWKKVSRKFLRVTFIEEEMAIIVITAVMRRKPPKRWIL